MCKINEIPWRNCENCLSETCHYRGINREQAIEHIGYLKKMDAAEYAVAVELLDNMPCFEWYCY